MRVKEGASKHQEGKMTTEETFDFNTGSEDTEVVRF